MSELKVEILLFRVMILKKGMCVWGDSDWQALS